MTELSVLMSVRGTSEWLGEALDSVFAQMPLDLEVLIAANGTSEHTAVWGTAQRYDLERVTVSMWDEERTLSSSLNALLGQAAGRFVMRLDPDDQVAEKSLHTVLQYARPGGRVVYGAYLDFGTVTRIVYPKPATADRLYQHSVGPYNYVVEAEALKHVGGWREVGYEDWDLLIRLVAAGLTPYHIGLVTLKHRVREDGRGAEFARTHAQRLEAMRQANAEWFRAMGVMP